MKVYLDDERQTPVGWERVYTVNETIQLLITRQVTELSLDNDLGEGQPEGYKILDWLEEVVYNDLDFPIPIITVHSANPVRASYMKRAIEAVKMIRQQQIEGEQT